MTSISCIAFLCFQIFPRQIIDVFGNGNELYYDFALRYFHIFLFCTFIVGAQILCAQFFPSIGKGGIGTVVSLSQQVFFLLPLVIIFPLIWGIDGVLWAKPRCRWLVRHFGAASCPAGNEKVVNKPCFPNIFSLKAGFTFSQVYLQGFQNRNQYFYGRSILKLRFCIYL